MIPPQGVIEDPGPSLDAGASLLGVYGLRNPTILWLLNRRPDLLVETPQEWRQQDPGPAPLCDCMVPDFPTAPIGEDDAGAELVGIDVSAIGDPTRSPVVRIPWELWHHPCGRRMIFRYVNGRPAWVCLAHDSDASPDYPYHYRPISRPPAKLAQLPEFNLWKEIGLALEGVQRDLVFDRGAWRLV